MVHLFDNPRVVLAEDSEAPIRHFAQVLQAYDPRFELRYIPEADRVTSTVEEIAKPFQLVEHTERHGVQVIRYLSAADMKRPDQILAWIWEGDFNKHRPGEVYDRIAKERKARELMDLAKNQEQAQERQEMTAWLVRGGRDRKNRVQLGRNRYVS